ncbi:MAG: SdrD B-like domain-containing protein, partial [Rubripirellula sp.]
MKRRSRGPERLEARRLLAADPIHVGVVYLETDYLETDQDVGSDSQGDRFILSFSGGAPGTELKELRIRTDKDGDGLSVGDPIYDTVDGGRGKAGSHGFQIVRVQTTDGRQVDAIAEVDDGGQELVLRLSNFHAGDRLEFTVDVDEVLRNAIDLEVFNDRLDVITSGQEFQDSVLEATFDAPHYETSHADAIFINDFGDPAQTLDLDLPADDSNDIDSRPNRSAAAVATAVQVARPIDISGQVWIDNDLDAVREPGEELLPGVQIALWRENEFGVYVDTGHRATTNAQGQYLFPKSLGLSPGNYRLVETQPDGLFSVAAVPGTVQGTTTGVVESTDVLVGINIPLGDLSSINNDFGEAQPASVSGFVYRDDNNDGIRADTEPGIAGVRVQLVPVSTIGPQTALTVTTAPDGSYSFHGLAPGSYEVIEVEQPAGLNDGIDAAGTVGGRIVGVADNPGDRISQIVLAGADEGIEYNFGEVPFGSISGFVYLVAPGQDCTGDHDAPGNEPLPGVEVALQTELGETLARTTTGADGGYFFGDIPVGNYRIVEFTPAGLLDGESHVGRIGNLQVGNSVDGGLISQIQMTPAGAGVEYNFCEAAFASISGYVYQDQSNDGVRDSNENGIARTQMSLVDANGQVVDSVRTDATGRYEFTEVRPGDYTIVEQQPTGFLDGIDSVGTIGGQSVGSAEQDDTLKNVVVNQGDVGVEYNFGELSPAFLFGRVHVDLDGDCLLDDNEETLEGVVIRLLDTSGSEVARTTTDAQGQYFFGDLVPGTYSIVEEQPAGFFDGDARAGTAGGEASGNRITDITLDPGETAVGYDFCERPPAEISGSVFSDQNGDCLFDPNETGISGVRVELYDDSGNLIASTQTDSAGNYRFTNLPSGNYTVREMQPAGWLHGGQRAGSAGGDDSVADVISRVAVGWGERLTQYNFCELEPSSISGSVFVDGNGDCIRDPSEPALEGVTIELRDASGTFITSTTTDANGRYSFGDLKPGQYQIFELQPDGFFHGGQTTGSGEVLADDLLGLTLTAGAQLEDNDFCELAPSSIRGFVFVDDDGDCHRDANEDPLEGVAIELRDADGSVVARTTTNAAGQYAFESLPPGQYQIFEQQPDGFFQGGQTVGTGDGSVLGEDQLGVNLLAGEQLVDYNFCELAPSSISGAVWQESEPNQRFDPGDVPVPGVMIELIDDSGDVVSVTKTDTSGRYTFDSLPPKTYSVREVQPAGLFHGGEVVGDSGGEVGDTDLLIGIELTGGTHADHYDFPEVPPATISGFVFQDGGAIRSADEIDPRDLRSFKDGLLTSDDTRLEGVTVELRNILGRPFDAIRALPGIYPDGPIRVTTDATGYYEFTGLRPGTYHVYQAQPEDYTDGLDTPGTTGGLAVNPADQVEDDGDRITIQTLAASEQTDPHDDAILNITLSGGGLSRDNNFSEVLITDPEFPQVPQPTTPVNPRVTTPIETFDSSIRLVAFADPVSFRSNTYANDEWAVSWHLSVINGGFPRGILGEDGIIHGVSAKQHSKAWTEGDHTNGQWTIMTQNGQPMELSDLITLGGNDAVALSGDFDGDGVDQAAIFLAGEWFVDLNGNGRWDAGDLWIQLGTELDRPVVGDWDGDGKDDIGIFGRQWQRDQQRIKRDPGLPDPDNKRRREVDSRTLAAKQDNIGEDQPRLLRRGTDGSLQADAVDHVFQYGEQADQPVIGDWNGDGIDQIAVFRGGTWMLDSDGDGRWTEIDQKVKFGIPGDEPIVGDFDGDEIDEIGVVRGDVWIIDTDGDRRITGNDQQIRVPRGKDDSQPIVGDFDG